MRGLFVAGGTGGHILAAVELGKKFLKEGHSVSYFSGLRPMDYKLMPQGNTKHLDIRQLKGQKIAKLFLNILINLREFFYLLKYFSRERVDFVMGTGGYVCGPVLLAAFLREIPVFILEQNSVMGLTNKLLAWPAKKIFLNFKTTKGIFTSHSGKAIFSGNPVREELCLEYLKTLQDESESKNTLRILVFGGSLGAEEINRVVDDLIKNWSGEFSLSIRHQVGNQKEQLAKEQVLLGQKNIQYEKSAFIANMGEAYGWADLVICRGGGGSISELRLVQRPSIIIPYPNHADRHQYLNAQNLKEEGEFPVYIHSGHELREKDCEKLVKILHEINQSKGVSANSAERKATLLERYNAILDTIFRQIEKICLSKRK